MRILVLSFYFRPDLCAGSFRTTPLVDAISELAPEGTEIEVITTRPHRYHSFAADAPEQEQRGGVTITRIALPEHQGGMLDQSRAFAAFARQAVRIAGDDYDLVFATSSRLMTAVLGAWMARRSRAPLYLDIRDIFADSIRDVLTGPASKIVSGAFSWLERRAVGRASRVNLVSRGFAPYFHSRYPRQRFSYHTNAIDDEFMALARRDMTVAVPEPAGARPLRVVYAGNIGEGQGLHAILPRLAMRMGARIHFVVIGDGGRKRALEQALAESAVTNVELLAPVARPELLDLYRTADVLFLHLNDYDAFRKVLPSKVFEYAALGKPVWAGVAGYAAQFLAEEVTNCAVFEPCDVEGAVRAFEQLKLEHTPRMEFVNRYSRAAVSRALAADVLSVARPAR